MKIVKAAIRINGKVYTGKDHSEAINKAKTARVDISKIDRERDGLFLTDTGKLIDRKQAKEQFGADHSHELIMAGMDKDTGIKGIDKGGYSKGRKFVIVSEDMRGLGFALLNKGDTVIMARNPDMEKYKDDPKRFKEYQSIGEGLVDVFNLKDVMARRSKMKDWYWVWDGNHSVEENELLRKEGFKVCLGGKRAYDLENDRELAIKLAEKYGLKSPQWKAFTSPEEGIKFLEANPDKAFVCKPNGADSYLTTVPRLHDPKKSNERMRVFIKSMGFKDYILQEMVKGIECNVECFFVNGDPKSASVNLECKRISSDDTGSLTGCSFDCVKDIAIDSKLVKATIGRMFPYYKENKITGFGDINCIIGERDIWFIEKCERFGYNQHENYFINIEKKDALNTLADMCDGTYKPDVAKVWGASICVYVDKPHAGIPMQIPEEMKDTVYLFDGMMKDGVLCETGDSVELAIVCAKDYEIKGAFAAALEKCELLRDEIINLDFRKDCIRDDYDTAPLKRWRSLEQMGYV